MKINYYKILLMMIALAIISCNTRKDVNNPSGILQLDINNQAGDQVFALNKIYTNLNNDQIDFNRVSYYISNVQLINANGDVWKENNSYHLVNVTSDNAGIVSILIDSLPQNEYTGIIFSLGIDPVRNSGGSQAGDLDPLNGMFWTWLQGYVFLKSEGNYYNSNPVSKGPLVLHIGNNDNYRTVRLDFDKKNIQKGIRIKADLLKIFGGFNGAAVNLKVPADNSGISIMSGTQSGLIADNYAKMFSILKVE